MIPPSEPVYQTSSTTQSKLEATTCFYERFVVKPSRPSIGTPLCYNDHPFFVDIPDTSQEERDIFGRVFTKEGNIFEGFIFDWGPIKELILRGIFEGM